MQFFSESTVESRDLAFCIHSPQIGASSLKLERKPDPHWKHRKLYIFPFGFQRLNGLIKNQNPTFFILDPQLGHSPWLCCVPQDMQ